MKLKYIYNVFFLSFLIVFLFPAVSYSQTTPECDLRFIDHLVNSGDYDEALFLLNSNDCLPVESDSASYLKGWSLYSLKKLEASSESLLKVSVNSPYYLKSRFFAAYNYTHTGRYSEAIEVLTNSRFNSDKFASIRNFEMSGIILLQGDIPGFNSAIDKVDTSFYEISGPSYNLRKISIDLRNHKHKSPAVAGLMSAVIPGSGKFYAGRKGGGISAFLATAGLGVVSWENYHKSGLSLKTVVFSSAFAISYVSNIFGAVMSVRIIENEYKTNVKNSVLFNLHIPLRNIFDR